MKIYNSLTRKKEEFKPIKQGHIGMYVCGPTVYDEPHIGHARSAYIFDMIRRYLQYKGLQVKFVRNVTDVDDKIIEKAKKEYKGEDLNNATSKVAAKYFDSYHNDISKLGILPPTNEPKATMYIEEMKKFIELLIKNGCAYASDGDVYFDIKKAKGYGKLSNQNIDKMEVGARIAPGEMKRDPLDFALWKKAKEDEPSWPSPWGPGRPGWHIECSVMSSSILGDEFDIHGGGIDLIFPHHENEIAQSEGAGKKFARYWIHHGLLTINSEKMAKSLGNYITIKDFLAKHKDPDFLKLFFLSAQYSSPIDYTEEKILEAKKGKERFFILFKELNKILKGYNPIATCRLPEDFKEFKIKFEEAMDDDFNTPLALANLFDAVTFFNKRIRGRDSFSNDEKETLYGMRCNLLILTRLLGLDLSVEIAGVVNQGYVTELIAERNAARKAKDFKKADDIRKQLSDIDIIIEDTKDGTEWRRKI